MTKFEYVCPVCGLVKASRAAMRTHFVQKGYADTHPKTAEAVMKWPNLSGAELMQFMSVEELRKTAIDSGYAQSLIVSKAMFALMCSLNTGKLAKFAKNGVSVALDYLKTLPTGAQYVFDGKVKEPGSVPTPTYTAQKWWDKHQQVPLVDLPKYDEWLSNLAASEVFQGPSPALTWLDAVDEISPPKSFYDEFQTNLKYWSKNSQYQQIFAAETTEAFEHPNPSKYWLKSHYGMKVEGQPNDGSVVLDMTGVHPDEKTFTTLIRFRHEGAWSAPVMAKINREAGTVWVPTFDGLNLTCAYEEWKFEQEQYKVLDTAVPWSSPNADPLGDVQKFAQQAKANASHVNFGLVYGGPQVMEILADVPQDMADEFDLTAGVEVLG